MPDEPRYPHGDPDTISARVIVSAEVAERIEADIVEFKRRLGENIMRLMIKDFDDRFVRGIKS